ncbi:hypothetical protein FA95DRAFT_1498735 [Auriscalpium vulgare]|uniref:Uncharacterized protein n=1 Tax=Auriscalpium vulgare TaxID=40419 RepID=A0ACB8RHI1_9AGAM|nr:hypothetical protein FA95DRAFT_1498735 [Auriscalpium vulgare]
MSDFLDNHAQRAQAGLYRREVGPGDHPCPTCPPACRGEAAFRCVDCLHRRAVCLGCLLKSHQALPFHRVEQWATSDRFWKRTTLSALGMILYLGHGGLPCEVDRGNLREMKIVHGRGIERIRVKFCSCIQDGGRVVASDVDQLMDCDLFPASWKVPETAFTMAVMKDLQLLALQTQATAVDLMRYLARSSDNIDPDDVDDRYREYMISQREFEYLSATKRAGAEPGRNMAGGSLAVLCPACPQPEINMDPQWKTRGPELRFLDAMYYATDGNFHLNQKIKPMDMADSPLTMGAAYFANEADYAQFLPRVPPKKEPEVSCTTCHEFGALGYGGHTGKVSGVVGLYCQRHMFALPGGLVDLQKGERFANVDYAMLSALQPWMDLETHVSGYDINCQYRINLQERLDWMRKETADLDSILKYDFPLTLAAVGKFHLPAHCEACRIFFSFHFLPWCAMTDGEAAERIWAILNSIGNATREMTPGHRHDFINALLSDLNARRVHGIGKYLSRKHTEAEEYLGWAKEELELAEREVGVEEKAAWKEELDRWLSDVLDLKKHKDMKNPFEPEKSAGGCSICDAQSTLLNCEGCPLSRAYSVADGLVDRSNLIRRLTTPHLVGDPSVAEAYKKFLTDLAAWKVRHDMYIHPLIIHATAGKPEHHTNAKMLDDSEAVAKGQDPAKSGVTDEKKRKLGDLEAPPARPSRSRKELTHGEMLVTLRERRVWLPSSYTRQVQQEAGVKAAAEIEFKLREGQANDALDYLRAHLISSYSFYLFKKDSKHTQGVETRTKSMERRKDDAIDTGGTTYRRARQARLALGMAEDDPTHLPLTAADIKPFKVYTADAERGDSKKVTSWIWSTFEKLLSSKNKSLRTWSRSALKALWFRRMSLHARWWEEALLVNEEMHRVLRSFQHFEGEWQTRADQWDEKNEAGRAAYSRKQAYRYRRLLEGAQAAFKGKISAPVYCIS